MAKARYNGTVQDLTGIAVNQASILITREGGSVEPLFSDREGTSTVSNPIQSEEDGSFFFHCAGGAFRLDISAPEFGTKTLRYIPVGLGGESDITALVPRGLYSSGTTYARGDFVKSGNYLFASLVDTNLNHTPDSTTPADTAYWMYMGPIAGATVTDVLTELGVHKITISESNPSGGVDGDVWFKVAP